MKYPVNYGQGLSNIGQGLGNAANTFANVEAQRQQQQAALEQQRIQQRQAVEYNKYQSSARRHDISLQNYSQSLLEKYEDGWGGEEYNMDTIQERFMSDMESFYNDNIRESIPETYRPEFEANYLYGEIDTYNETVNTLAINLENKAIEESDSITISQALEVPARGGLPSASYETIRDVVGDQVARGSLTEQQREYNLGIYRDGLNSDYLSYTFTNHIRNIDPNQLSVTDVVMMFDHIIDNNGNLTPEEQRIADGLIASEGADILDFATAEKIRTSIKSIAVDAYNENVSAQNNAVSEARNSLAALDAKQYGGITHADVWAAGEGMTKQQSDIIEAAYIPVANANADNKLWNNLSTQAVSIAKTGTREDVDSFLEDNKWGLFFTDEYDSQKEEVFTAVKDSYDMSVVNKVAEWQANIDLSEDNIELSEEDKENIAAGEYMPYELKDIVSTIYNESTRESVSVSNAKAVLAEMNLKVQERQESNYIELQKLVFNRNQSEEKEKREITNAYLREDITEGMMKNLMSLVPKFGYTQQVKDADNAIMDQAIEWAGGEKNTAAVNHYYSILWGGFTKELDNNPNQDSPDFVSEVLNSFLTDDNRAKDYLNYQYGTDSARNWNPGKDESGNVSDFDNYLWFLSQNPHAGGYSSVPYNLAAESVQKDLYSKFGEIPLSYWQDNYGPMYSIENADLVPEVSDMLKKRYPEMDPAKTTVRFQYGVVEGSDSMETALYVGVQTDKGVLWHEFNKSPDAQLEKAETVIEQQYESIESQQETFGTSRPVYTLPTESQVRDAAKYSNITNSTMVDVLDELKNMKGMNVEEVEEYISQREEDYPEAYAFIKNYYYQPAKKYGYSRYGTQPSASPVE